MGIFLTSEALTESALYPPRFGLPDLLHLLSEEMMGIIFQEDPFVGRCIL